MSKLSISSGVLTCFVGFIYMSGLFGQVESEVITWGLLLALLGGLSIFFELLEDKTKRLKVINSFILHIIVLLQLLPIYLWFSYYGISISDGTPSNSFVAHYLFAVPHIATIILCLLSLYPLIKAKKDPLIKSKKA
ncbi:hypothetical protein [Cytobacillus sp. IB215665]|uniref:hypothetical protein n=1 Tax=Cytobacillus sp. IB215665 TaxID=3097357 RepID=UPI002A0AB5AE|nr:hypothetical protein [Cytobacillus sp. IB215665]MDX8365638.1 hypothetical protein [Cytobacillus sp. IB215665]